LSTAALQARGLSAFRASALARSGWLVHLARGVYMLPGDTLTRDGSLAFLSAQTPGLHVGSKTALAWRGVRQTIAFREHLQLWGDTPRRLPEWFTQRFPAGYQATQLFDDALPQGFGLQPLPAGDPRVLVSVPERAMLELLSDVGKLQSLAEARELVESLPGLREKVLDELLTHTTRIKVVRMAATFAASMQLPSGGHEPDLHRHRSAAARHCAGGLRIGPVRHEGWRFQLSYSCAAVGAARGPRAY